MVGRNRLSIVVCAVALPGAAGILMGCSSDDSASIASSPFDGGTVIVPEAGPQPLELKTVQVQGEGTVASGDDLADSGVGEVACAAGSPASLCTARQGTTLYAIAAVGWVLSGWTTTGLAPGVDITGGASNYTITAASPSPLIVVFIPQAGGTPVDAGPALVDAGANDS